MTQGFTTGMAHMQEAIEEGKRKAAAAKAAATGASGSSANYFNWKPGDVKILRFLTDDVIIEHFAQFIFDNTGNTKNFMIPPSDPTILERYRSPAPGIGWQQNYRTKALEEPKPKKLGVGIAVLRKEEPNAEGKMELQDYLYEQEIEGTKYLSRHFGIVQQTVSNFWHTLAVNCFNRYGTICDRDYLIERSGEGFDTKYGIIPLDPDPELASAEAVQQFYFYGQPWTQEDPDRFLKCPQTLPQWAEYFSSEDRYKHWLAPKDGTVVPAPASYSPPAALTTSSGGSGAAWAGDNSDVTATAQAPSTEFSSFKTNFKDQLLKSAKPE